MSLGQCQDAVEKLQDLVAEEPLHEGAHARLIVALAGSGQRAAALTLFTKVRTRLVEELGVEPGPELRDAQTRVLRGDVPATRAQPRHPDTGPPVYSPPAQLPADVPGFVGRTDHLRQLDRLLPATDAASPTPVAIAVIAGMAGVGKTALATHWAQHAAGRFGDGQLYVDLQGYGAGPALHPLQALAGLLRTLGVAADRVPAELDEAEKLYRTLLAGRRILVVLDDARDAEQVRPLLPGGPGPAVIVTSRNQLTGLVASHGASSVTLDVLTPDEALALLTQMLGEDRVAAEPEEVAALARACGLLPLALRIAAANSTRQPRQSVAGYLTRLLDGDRLGDLAVDGDAHAAVRIAFDHSYEHLQPAGRRLFRLLGLAPGADISVPATAALAAATPEGAHRLLVQLLDANLVEPRGPDRYGLHDLLRLYAKSRTEAEDTSPERAEAVSRLLDWYLHTSGAAATLLYPGMLRLPLPSAATVSPPAGFAAAGEAVAWLDAERPNLVG